MQRRGHPHARGSRFGLRSLPTICRPRVLGTLLLVLTPTLLYTRLWSAPRPPAVLSRDVEAFLTDLELQLGSAGAEVHGIRARLLKVAAGALPESKDGAAQTFYELLYSIKSFGQTLPCLETRGTALSGAHNTSACAGGCFFASNLHNSFEILPNYVLQLLAVLGRLDPGDAQRSFVSIYESGSTDRTPLLLEVLSRILRLLGVRSRIVTNGALTRQAHARGRRWAAGSSAHTTLVGDARIAFLAAVRNAVLEPLTSPGCRAGGSGGAAAAGASGGAGAAAQAGRALAAAGAGVLHAAGGGGSGSSGGGAPGVQRASVLRHLAASQAGAAPAASASAAAGEAALPSGERPGAAAPPAGPRPDRCAAPGTRRVVFLNDVFFCSRDVLRLLAHTGAHLACGMDWIKARLPALTPPERAAAMRGHLAAQWGLSDPWAAALSRSWLGYRLWKKLYGKTAAWWPWSRLIFYDIWVARDLSGRRFTNRPPYLADAWSRERLAAGAPLPVYCCWNGAAVLDAEALGAGGLRFRSHGPGECAGSECSLLCDDLHASGRHRVLLDPGVRLVYDWVSALELYGNLDSAAPDGVEGVPYAPLGGEALAEEEGAWGAWGARGAAAGMSVECCGILPGRDTADFERGCTMVTATAAGAGGGREQRA